MSFVGGEGNGGAPKRAAEVVRPRARRQARQTERLVLDLVGLLAGLLLGFGASFPWRGLHDGPFRRRHGGKSIAPGEPVAALRS